MATFLYGYQWHHLQQEFWNEISKLNRSSSDPWMIVGNLNKLTTSLEKFANSKGHSTRYDTLKKTLDKNSLVDIGFTCLWYIWFNNCLLAGQFLKSG